MNIHQRLFFFLALQLIACTMQSAVDPLLSCINFPTHNCYVNTPQPIISATFLDNQRRPVAGESVDIFLDASLLATTTTNSYGIFLYAIEASLTDGPHLLTLHCVESAVDLAPVTFTVDTEIPPITITSPTQDQSISSDTVTVSGSTEALAMVTLFMDDDTYGVICFADENGSWNNDFTLQEGTHSVTAQAFDIAGNTSPLSDPRVFSVTI